MGKIEANSWDMKMHWHHECHCDHYVLDNLWPPYCGIGGKSIRAHTIPQQPIFNDCAQLRFDDSIYNILRFENKKFI
jgi:hypothetical protein